MTDDVKTLYEAKQRRWSDLDQEFQSFVPHYKELGAHLLPRAGRYLPTDVNDGKKKHNLIYDSTGTRAIRVLAAGLMSGATSPARPWFRLAVPDQNLMKSAAVKQWLSESTKVILSMFHRSNIYRALHTMYGEKAVFGTASSFIMDDFDTAIRAYPMTAGEYRLAADYRGVVNTMMRHYVVNVDALVEEFGYANCSPRVQRWHDNRDFNKKVEVIHSLEPRKNRDRNKRDALNMPFQSCYFEKGYDSGKVLRDGGMKHFRALAPRWEVTSGDVYGTNCPGMEMLGDVKQLQHQQYRKAQGIDYYTEPPLQGPAGGKNYEVENLPGGFTTVDTTSSGGGIKTLFETRLDLQHLLMDIQDIRERIRAAAYSDLFLMVSQRDSTMTATEVAELHEEKMLVIGPVLERLHDELLSPLVDIAFERALTTGLLPPPPEELAGQDLQVEFVSVLAQAQRAISTNSIDRFVVRLGEIATMKPAVLDRFDEDKWADAYSDMLGVDPELVVPTDKAALVRKARAQDQQQQQQAAMLQQGADTAQKLAGASTEGRNVLTDVMSSFSGYGG